MINVLQKMKDWKYKMRPSMKRLDNKPDSKIAIVTCIDGRMGDSIYTGGDFGEVVTIRNAGNILTGDLLRSLLIAIYKLGVEKVYVIGHIDCGNNMNLDDMRDLYMLIATKTGLQYSSLVKKLGEPEEFLRGFEDERENVYTVVKQLKHTSLLPDYLEVKGFLYDVSNGTFETLVE